MPFRAWARLSRAASPDSRLGLKRRARDCSEQIPAGSFECQTVGKSAAGHETQCIIVSCWPKSRLDWCLFCWFSACWLGGVSRHYDTAFFSVDDGRPPSRPFLLAASVLAGLFDIPPFRPRLRIHADVPRTPRANAGMYRSASSRGKCNPMPCPSITISAISAGVALSMP